VGDFHGVDDPAQQIGADLDGRAVLNNVDQASGPQAAKIAQGHQQGL